MEYLLAVDIGTSACKTALFAAGGQVIAQATHPYPVHYPAPGWAEQDPEDWWAAAKKGIKDCLEDSGINPAAIAGIGIDGQSWAAVAVDAKGETLCPTPIWMDTRAAGLCAGVEEKLGRERVFAVSGNPFSPSYTTPKLLWYRQERPEVWQQARWFLQSNSFIAYRLTGKASGDRSQGYGLHCFSIQSGEYEEGLCRELGIDPGKLPPLYPSHAVVGGVTPQAARETGLLAGTPVAAGGLDAACGSLGAGVCAPGLTQEQGGQAGGMSVCMENPTAHPALILSCHVVPGQWLLQGGSVGGGGSLRWLVRELGQLEMEQEKADGVSAFRRLDELAAAVPPGADGLLFLPYLSGERSPIWDPEACGVYFGLDYQKTRGHFFRALLEGAAYALEHNLRCVQEAGVPVGTMHAVGGAANSRLWTQIKADVTGKPIRVPDSDMATCLGAAILAGVGTGLYPDFQAAVEKTVHFRREYQPDPERHALYQRWFPLYRELYSQLAGSMHRRARLLGEER